MTNTTPLEALFDSLGMFDSLEEFVHGPAGSKSPPGDQVRPGLPGRSNSAGKGRARRAKNVIARVTRKVPEVMVKVSSVGKQTGRVWAHLTYITRNGQIEAENEEGEILSGLDEIKELHEHWSQQIGKRRANGKQTVNMVLSMPVGTNPERLKEAAREFAKQAFANHEYVFVLHTPETDPDPDAPPHPHIHLAVKARGKDGRRLVHGREELQEWREMFAEQLRARGIEAAATPRNVRGIVKKAMRQPVYQASKANRSTVKASAIRDAARAVLDNSTEARPWEQRIADRQTTIRAGWTALADVLDKSAEPGDAALAQQVRAFVRDMPAPLTQQQELEQRMRDVVRKRAAQAEKQAANEQGAQSSTTPRPATKPQQPPKPRGDKDYDRD
ncbi:relaxase/mobilization nuclease domain-containing protein [Burkholderia cenocepacia]|uniref:relaxase/mobilization nuclease domain-containing protein n=1 Tax=Burkholderia cenocepacia TaxID=95486 RepID=UPI00264EC7A4|nr:relaxase/mobilization nuclease domain-containing protein [Burkholderia cenocepacia]MDN7664092.1 hypothetical protein [Burkholderia cenocepacia]